MKRVVQTLAALALAGAVIASAVVGLGLYNVSARVGHLPGVSWVLHTTFRNAVALRADAEAPDLETPAMIELGARHYATACAPCHAAPGRERTATSKAMVPAPPHIEEAVRRWGPSELHWIVYNGVKMSGMPPWPAPERKEEVWPVVAYLMQVKDGLAPGEQATLTALPEGDGPDGAAYCAGCHAGLGGAVPRLDIQTARYLEDALADYRDGTRESGIMEQAASTIPPEAVPRLAAHLAAREVRGPDPGPPSPEGEALATRGTDDVPACVACHGPDAPRRKPGTPALAGQNERFLSDQLRLWRDGLRGGSPLMEKAAMDLTDAEIALLAAYYASLPPQSEPLRGTE